MPITIEKHSGGIIDITENVMPQNLPSLSQHSIGAYEPAPRIAIIPALQIVQPGLGIVHISAIPQRVEVQQVQIACTVPASPRLAPRAVVVFTHQVPVAVSDADDVPLQVVQVVVVHAVIVDHRRTALRVIVEVQGIGALGHVHEEIAVIDVIRCYGGVVLRDGFGRPQAVVVVQVYNR